jgi:hypothetical protein
MEEKKDNLWIIGILTVFVVSILFIVALYVIYKQNYANSLTLSNSSVVVSALFSAFAFAGIIITVLLQRKELELQRKELRSSTEQLKAQKDEFHTQNDTIKLQRFENTFFQMISLHHDIVNSISYIEKYNRKTYSSVNNSSSLIDVVRGPQELTSEEAERNLIGRGVFEYSYIQVSKQLNTLTDIVLVNKTYLEYYREFQNSFGHYFRNLYRIIKLVEQTDFTFDEKYSYTSIIRAQLSDFELLCLYYNCLSEKGVKKFKPFIEKYTIFKNLPKNNLANSIHITYYAESAFEKKKIDKQ